MFGKGDEKPHSPWVQFIAVGTRIGIHKRQGTVNQFMSTCTFDALHTAQATLLNC